ncbi:dihydroorotase [Desulfurococcus mucosus]|uniref:Amidohydrolase n=1 Tax=Desulfurococcus mucosus (strain ATCC 35584 / DSM 2162 / JCM 9187 / O7/1) TaxID=765177 RepID=E8R8J7_DESM0|nr:dihydroorotase family protein [Desulfurococcus mucosus]ADV64823.1 amidohydrolase [Desulfurococcus mucosus DSM 2162]
MPTLLIKNAGIPLSSGDIVEANIYVEDGVITYVGKREAQADEVLDAGGRITVPGGIDIHAHIYDQAYAGNEDWETGSLAAAFGGLTTVVDMPLRTIVDNERVLEEKLEEARRNSYLNYGVIGGFINEKNYTVIPELARRGVRLFKFFTCRPFKISDDALPEAFEHVAIANGVAVVHAEDEALIGYWERKLSTQNTITAYHSSRTGSTEASAIYRVGYIGLDVGARVHIAHLSSREGVEAVANLKKKTSITSEVTPHHLFFTREDSARFGAYLKVAPTLKSIEDRDALWRGLEAGVIDAYVSDNAPAPRSMKEVNVWEAWGGVPNLEVMMPFLFTYGVLQRRLSLARFIEVTARNPARILGVYPLKGELAVGSHADIVVLETGSPRKITASTHHHKVDWTPWEGMELYGHPYHLIVNGSVLIEGRELVGKKGLGIYIGELKPRRR